MAGKRRRTRSHRNDDTALTVKNQSSREPVVKAALLKLYYLEVFSLREYLLSKLPPTSKVRRRKIMSLGRNHQKSESDEDSKVALALDQTLIGVFEFKEKETADAERQQLWTSFSQRRTQDDSRVVEKSVLGSFVSQSEIIDCCIFAIFQKSLKTATKHLLCQGYRKDVFWNIKERGDPGISSIPGILSNVPNHNVSIIKSDPWTQILSLMGREGEKVMFDLVLNCGIYLAMESGQGNYHQLSGIPLGDLELRVVTQNPNGSAGDHPIANIHGKATLSPPLTPGSIMFVRNRMLYARASHNARGGVRFGFRHIHALNRYPYKSSNQSDEDQKNEYQKTVVIMKHIFPRQFGLHNVFTSKVDRQDTAHPFKDYTLREDEFNGPLKKMDNPTVDTKIPKRLRGTAIELIEKLRKLHDRCPYYELLKHYCSDATSQVAETSSDNVTEEIQIKPSVRNTQKSTQIPEKAPPETSLLARATSVEAVSAFCHAVFNRLIPNEFWGRGEFQEHNKSRFLLNVDRFVKLRRYENLSLHEVVQEMEITEIEWLCPPRLANTKTSQTDINKRLEIFHEFMYYLFDSLLIPLIRANFHVTESGAHRYRIFFFRHDVWKEFSEPAMASLKASMFEEVKTDKAHEILASRSLGFSQVRLLPKAVGVRPIMNLKRKTLMKGSKTGLGYSINQTLAPVFNMLTYEKNTYPERLGSAMFSVGEIYKRLKTFKLHPRSPNPKFYFAKVDVQAAFDTIPQSAVIKLMRTLPHESLYRIAKHVEIQPGEGYRLNPDNPADNKPVSKWKALAKSPHDPLTFAENLIKENEGLAEGKKNTVFVETINGYTRSTNDLLNLLEDHIKRNLVKIGKKFYRQKEGIPQGSVISSLLCNYFYADLEQKHLSFLNTVESLLMRLTDDFLLITTNKPHAERFLDTMLKGVPEYGVTVKPSKTLTNFPFSFNSQPLMQIPSFDPPSSTSTKTKNKGEARFPYCNTLISTSTLAISKSYSTYTDPFHPSLTKTTADSLTIEYSRTPGKTFKRKVANALKITMGIMYLDKEMNGMEGVVRNLGKAVRETAEKMCVYGRALGRGGKRVRGEVVRGGIEGVVKLAGLLIRRRKDGGGRGGGKGVREREGYKCALTKWQVEWLVLSGFREVMRRRQSGYAEVLAWLETRLLILEMDAKKGMEIARIVKMIH